MIAECRECHNDVSDAAPKCPHCGVRTPVITRKKRIMTWLVFLIALPLSLIGLFILFLILVT
ncbi:hypothetical protein NX722_13565 [Endozoicomonas gorgoniicola]|uniref:Zinc ribbon domain-containing protein n=1 Tax=Endozoicomonas gorgoniicola TaxID=1234144 RepID=A0ABT3MW83_9GAMM|nr:hypothetical protein [Endozoicomonas gorgoniicola]MCW7553636.1 hypothetical protein [Endozoicomonas gorgoniicola]